MSRAPVLLLVGLLLLVPSAHAQEEAPLAVLMALEGEVAVRRVDGAVEPGRFGMPLNAGDEVRTGDESEADILFSSGSSIHLGAGSTLGIQGAPAEAVPTGGRSFGSVRRYLKLKEQRGTSSLGGLRSGGGSADLAPLAPCETRVRSDRPSFRWAAREGVGELRLTIYDESEVHWTGSVAGATEFAYPESAPPLRPGVRYSWTLETTDPLQIPPLRTPAVYFELLEQEDRERLDYELDQLAIGQLHPRTIELLRASILYDFGLAGEAIAFTEAALADEDDDELRSILARLYLEVGRSEDALREYDRLMRPR